MDAAPVYWNFLLKKAAVITTMYMQTRPMRVVMPDSLELLSTTSTIFHRMATRGQGGGPCLARGKPLLGV